MTRIYHDLVLVQSLYKLSNPGLENPSWLSQKFHLYQLTIR